MTVETSGPMEQFAVERNYDEQRDSTVIFDAGDFFGFAREQDRKMAALVEALTGWQRWAEEGGCDLDEYEEGALFRASDAALAAVKGEPR